MEAVLTTWSTKDLKAECQKNGMAQYGDKAQLIQRILDNIPGKRKPGPKPGGAPKPAIGKKTSAKDAFAAKTRKALVALGITDKKAQDLEISKRWATQSKSTATAGANIKTYPIKLDQKHMTSLGLQLVGTSADAAGNAVFNYKAVSPSKAAPKTPPNAAAQKAAALRAQSAAEEEEEEVDDGASESGSERSDDLMDDDTFEEYKTKLAGRLADRRVPKKLLIELIKAFDPDQKLSGADKAELSERAVEQLMYETDGEEEE